MDRLTEHGTKKQNFSASATEIVERARITEVAEALGVKLDRSRHRGVAGWRDGEHFSVALDDSKGTWYDHAANEGGGVLGLIARATGSDRQSALRWLAEYCGVQIEDRPLSLEERKAIGRERAESKRIRREASYFADAATLMAELALEELPSADLRRADHTRLIAALRLAPETEYRRWLTTNPRLAAALVHAGRERRGRLCMALARWIAKRPEEQNAAA